MVIVVDCNDREVDFDAAVNLMDDEVREKLHMEFAPCTVQEFFTAYEKAHYQKYNEEFQVN